MELYRTMVQDCVQDVAQSKVFTELVTKLEEANQLVGSHTCLDSVQELVVYGLGSVEDSRVSRFQLAMALLLRERLRSLATAPLLYDPAFSEVDALIFASYQMDLIQQNEEGRRAVQRPTFFYLPHCEGALCDNLIAANWSVARLSSILILGNSFNTYQERWSSTTSRPTTCTRPDHMLQLVEAGAVLELPVRDFSFHVMSAFNDMSLHLFPADKLRDAGLPD